MSTAPTAVIVEHACKIYGHGDFQVRAVDGVSLTLNQGDLLAIMGPSGCGKTTLLNLISGLDRASSGHITLCGYNLDRLSDDERCRLRLHHLGFVFQNFNLFPTFTVEENVAWPLEFLGCSWRQARQGASDMLAQVGIERSAQRRRPSELSGGEQQRVAIARALVTKPSVLMADEPTGNLDSVTGRRILDLLHSLNRNHRLSMILVTHSEVVARAAERILRLEDGRVVAEEAVPRDSLPQSS